MVRTTLLYWFTGIIFLLALAPVFLSVASRFHIPLRGVRAGRLLPCPARLNCVCSEEPGKAEGIAPLRFSGESDRAWTRAVWAVQQMGGQVLQEENGYLHAIFRSRFYRFIDDLELRLDREHRVIHLRSAARAGYSDFGVNRKRAEQLQALFQGS
jgi:uncharacterized protein (DUF1499 family)